MDSESAAPLLEQPDIPQSEPLNENQVCNNAGGFVFKIDNFSRLRRFVILGSNGNNYYISDKQLGIENCECVLELLAEGHGLRVVEEVTRISKEGRAPRQSPGILVLAVCARLGDLATRRAALAALPAVCRTASTLFEFVQYCKDLGPVTRASRLGDTAADPKEVNAWLDAQKAAAVAEAKAKAEAKAAARAAARAAAEAAEDGDAVEATGPGGRTKSGSMRPRRGLGNATPLAGSAADAEAGDMKASWGRSMRRAIARWYLDKSPAAVAYQVTKYSQRHGWGHADLLRLAHPDPEAYASKKRKLMLEAVAKKEEGEMKAKESEKGDVGDGSGAGDVASHPDSDWVLVPEKMAEGTSMCDNGGTGEMASLEAAMAATGLAAADSNDAANVAEAQRVADMKAIFDFLTHGTVPGQERPERRAKRLCGATAAATAAGGTGAAEHTAVAAPAAAATGAAGEGSAGDSMQVDSGAVASTVTIADDANIATAEGDPTSDQATANTHLSEAATAVVESAAAAAAAPMSPVMQYLVDAHLLRKEIRAPAPLVKKTASESSPRRQQLNARHRFARKVARNEEPAPQQPPDPAAIAANEAAHAAAVAQAVSLVRRHRFGHEHVGDTTLLRAPELWAAFLEVGMPLTALMRNLGRMTEIGVLQRPDCLEAITRRLNDGAALAAARVHPMTILEALCTYRNGAGARGVARWTAEPKVIEALDAGFYMAFKNVVPTGQRYLLGLDVSGSMESCCAGMTSVSCRAAAAAMLMSLVRTEPWVKTLAFSHQLEPLEVEPSDKIEHVVKRCAAIQMGGTDCALPMIYATKEKLPVDVFVALTDNETWCGSVHPAEALRQYRQKMGMPHAKLVVLAFSATKFSIADPEDPGMLDVAGLDSAVPQLVADFVTGKV
ncbi:hypothetical protein Vretimale_347 [Volvox reticuliferus]|uniref:TROVE domain-containing protein n=1 Tax=Volvox reticuliferus TaxID=1737510 RepID=A0A8J4CD98_9CHLO|nr:hypothetical protein Vretifemale_8143 [Volvox reticuliferus]GIL94003.1 hypothetical protein Vretimale_347 [Volvox reticuliferus]